MAARLGYACISVEQRKLGVFTSRKPVLGTLRQLGGAGGLELLQELTRSNLRDLIILIRHNESNGIRFFRISSGTIPHFGNGRLAEIGPELADWAAGRAECLSPFHPLLAEAGELARRLGHRLTMHPGQFCQLGSPHERVVGDTIRELSCHHHLLAAMNIPSRGPNAGVLIVHGGGVYPDMVGEGHDPRVASMARWRKSFLLLPPSVAERIVLENDELYSIEELLPQCQESGVPLCVDFFHDTLRGMLARNGPCAENSELMGRAFATWAGRGGGVKCHLSEQAEGGRRGAHADRVATIPGAILTLMRATPFDLCIESKDKDESVLELFRLYPELDGRNSTGE